MRKYQYKGAEMSMLSRPEEISLGLWLQTMEGSEDVNNITYYLRVMEVLGLPKAFVDVVDADTAVGIIKDWHEDFTVDLPEDGRYPRTVEIYGKTYQAYAEGESWSINARMLGKIEEAMRKDEVQWMLTAMAMVFGIDTGKEKENIRLASKIPMSVALAYVYHISEQYKGSITKLMGLEDGDSKK